MPLLKGYSSFPNPRLGNQECLNNMPLLKGYSLFPNPGLGNQSQPYRSKGNLQHLISCRHCANNTSVLCLDTNAYNVKELLVTYKPLPLLLTSLLSLLAIVSY